MKVIERRWSKRITCKKCGTLLEISKEDLYAFIVFDDCHEDSEPHLEIECSVCHECQDITFKVPECICKEILYKQETKN